MGVRTGIFPLAIERQLAHLERNRVTRAYNKDEFLPERQKMMQLWGDYLHSMSGWCLPRIACISAAHASEGSRFPELAAARGQILSRGTPSDGVPVIRPTQKRAEGRSKPEYGAPRSIPRRFMPNYNPHSIVNRSLEP
jgi:hypothetical protein